jgi:histidine triad (HIT) family protein
MPNTLGSELINSIKKISLKLIQEKKAEGINVIINNEPSAGQVVFHTHIHIIPRKSKDGIKIN